MEAGCSVFRAEFANLKSQIVTSSWGGMRQPLMQTFDEIDMMNPHGGSARLRIFLA
jgi:hypothetical protein